ncbi:hypothetical protein ACFTXM_11375 [Streptomyces sp. NPDC056930]|uniref:hypothetical protein n=1 Tax=Streptomyces sp. NPDC056930 TaxID=3345967 RepID=UPI00362F08FE
MEFREVPLPRSVREEVERYEEKHGTTKEGYLLRGPIGYYTEPMERRRVQRLSRDLPAEGGVGMYGSGTTSPRTPSGTGYRSPTWRNGWATSRPRRHIAPTGTCRTHRHLMPGSISKAARVLDAGLWDAA